MGETLRCSIGLAPNRYLAKLASDMMKPDGMTVLLTRDLPQALYRLSLRDLIGVSSAMERRIRMHGVTTVEQLCRLSPAQMRNVWGSVVGERMWHWLRGADFVDPVRERQSIGKQHVLAPDLRTREKAYAVAQKLLQNAAANLRKADMWARAIGVYVGFLRQDVPVDSWKAEVRISECRDTFSLMAHLERIWADCPAARPLQVGVRLFDLVPDGQHTPDLFENHEKQLRLSEVIDSLNDKYGNGAVHPANVGTVPDAAPTRIPFLYVPDLKEF